ncbi:hypothetical protein [Roseisalinus antarcticus]|uniref:ABC transporter permease n=1 Tax=Roseisalinus antarcticus TaxID=254357 RepID=A0A1Y5RIZ3_9RHOB|nr:hypothetical protein [Roseisalinus antarcticus]SLN15978.1 hypothetical protein ROA7023_00240 [Roseisalinus antarcticus]
MTGAPLIGRLASLGWSLLIALILAFLLLPLVFIVLFAFNDAPYIQFPPTGFSLRWVEDFLSSPEFM